MNNQYINISKDCYKCKIAKCKEHCPLHLPIPEILELISNNEELAAELLYQKTTMPFVCGALCDTLKKCRGHCIKNNKSIGVSFNEVETYLGNKYIDKILYKPNFSIPSLDVALIGGGIGNLCIALRLINNGIKPTIFEKKDKIGGVLINSLPDFRYDKSTILKVIDFIKENSNIYYHKEFGNNLKTEDLENYQYVVLGIGSSIERKVLKDESVYQAIDLLENKEKRLNLINKNVVVLGGGNVCFDIARTLKKEGANVTIVYRRDLLNAPASKKEIKEALLENIVVKEKLSPVKVIKNDTKVVGITLEKMELFDDGTNRKSFKKTNEFIDIKTDAIVEALGSISDYTYLQSIFPHAFDESNNLIIDDKNQLLKKGYYACGDFVTGPNDFASAVSMAEIISKDILSKFFNHPFISNKEVVIGGSFNPPTKAHLEMMKVINKFNPKKIILLPNGDHYKLSYQDKTLNSFKERVNLLKELIKDSNLTNCEISEIENDHNFIGTYFSLIALNHPTFVLGSDCLFDFPKWHHYEELVENNNFVVFMRKENYQKCLDFINSDKVINKHLDHFLLLDLEMDNISSTDFRINNNEQLLSINVYKYIKSHKLYEVNNNE